MNALEYVKDQMSKSEYGYEDVVEFLEDANVVWSERRGANKWYIDEFRVVKVGESLIGFMWGITTGDIGILEIGWEFDERSICFVEEHQKTIKYYVPVQADRQRYQCGA